MDRRFDMYRQGFTHQIRNMTIDERHRLTDFFAKKYGPSRDHVLVNDKYVEQLNNHWRWQQQKRRFTEIYVKHEQDLVMLGLKFGAKIG
jgi:hypothetical protein